MLNDLLLPYFRGKVFSMLRIIMFHNTNTLTHGENKNRRGKQFKREDLVVLEVEKKSCSSLFSLI